MTERKNRKGILLFALVVCLMSTGVTAIFLFHQCRQTVYAYLSGFCIEIAEAYPGAEEVILSVLKENTVYGSQGSSESFLRQNGYTEAYFLKNLQVKLGAVAAALLLAGVLLFGLVLCKLRKNYRIRIEELTDYLEQINLGKSGTLVDIKEDDFSRLEDELFKTITHLYQAKDEAQKARKNYADNLANIAHQLKTPITAAELSLQLMNEKQPSAYAERIQRQLRRLTVLEEALLTLSQIDAGTLKLERSLVDIYTVLNLAADNLNDLFNEKNLKVKIPEKGCTEIWGDLEWTMQAVMNVMKNCMEHSPKGGTIHCDYGQNPLYTELLIWDEGEGFAGEDMAHLFDRFYRGKRAKGNGIGIGLSLAKAIFEMQNGNMLARNLPHGGACFEIRIYGH